MRHVAADSRSMKWLVGLLAVVVAAGYWIFEQRGPTAEAATPARPVANRKSKDDRVEALMEKVHQGKRSPFGRTKTLLAADAPDWAELDKHLTAFAAMVTALKQSPAAAIRDSSDGYADAITALSSSVRQKDRTKARAALKSLMNSCADCHFQGGPGGKLDD